MNIALVGYGKMGQAIEEIAQQRGHQVVLRLSLENLEEFTAANLQKADVAIEFTGPESAAANIRRCLEWGVPVVSGSTGWLQHRPEIEEYCRQVHGAFLYASNFSVGVNLFFELNKTLARLMAPHGDYSVTMEEIHHTAKKDAPSGTAITLAEQIIENLPQKSAWINQASDDPALVPIISRREDPAPGTHIVRYASAVDDIEITHTAHNRKGFATGAVLAAEFLRGKKGIFGMKDVLGL